MKFRISVNQKQQRYQGNEILEHAADKLTICYVCGNTLVNPDATKKYVHCKPGSYGGRGRSNDVSPYSYG